MGIFDATYQSLITLRNFKLITLEKLDRGLLRLLVGHLFLR